MSIHSMRSVEQLILSVKLTILGGDLCHNILLKYVFVANMGCYLFAAIKFSQLVRM
jgi:hypothetical protein